MSFEIEEIPDKDNLYRRVNKAQFMDGELIPQVFSNLGKGMSTDWSKYSTPSETKNRGNNPDDGVISLKVKDVRNIENQIVEHTPSKNNKSHTDVKGEKTEKVRVEFSRIFNWEIKPLEA
jgi:hypothetical protein